LEGIVFNSGQRRAGYWYRLAGTGPSSRAEPAAWDIIFRLKSGKGISMNTFAVAALASAIISIPAYAAKYEGLEQSRYDGSPKELSVWVGASPDCPISTERAYQVVSEAIQAAGAVPLRQSMQGIELSVTASCINPKTDGDLAAYIRVQFDNTMLSPEGQFRPTQGNYDEIVFAPAAGAGDYLLGVIKAQVAVAASDFVASNRAD
jgi:hypothetical protein